MPWIWALFQRLILTVILLLHTDVRAGRSAPNLGRNVREQRTECGGIQIAGQVVQQQPIRVV